MIFFVNSDITIYKHYVENKTDKYKRIYIPEANWQTKRNCIVSNDYSNGIVIKDSTLIFIDPIDEVLEYGDIIVKGKSDIEINSKSELKGLNTISVMSFRPLPNHYEIEGV